LDLPLDGTAGVVAVVVLTAVAMTFFVLSVRSAHRAQEWAPASRREDR